MGRGHTKARTTQGKLLLARNSQLPLSWVLIHGSVLDEDLSSTDQISLGKLPLSIKGEDFFFFFFFFLFFFCEDNNPQFRIGLHLFSSRWDSVLPFAFLTPWGKYKVIKKEPHWNKFAVKFLIFFFLFFFQWWWFQLIPFSQVKWICQLLINILVPTYL